MFEKNTTINYTSGGGGEGLQRVDIFTCRLLFSCLQNTRERIQKIFHKHIFKRIFFSQKSVRLISNTVVAVALYMLHMSHLSFLLTGVQIRISNSLFFFFFNQNFHSRGVEKHEH